MLPDADVLILFLLVLARISSFLIAAPFFALGNFPAMVKAGLALVLAGIILPVLPVPELGFNNWLGFALAVGREIFVGLAMGYVCTLVFSALSVGGQLIDIQIGFFASQMFDPMFGGQVTIISRFLFLLGLIFFLNTNIHHDLISILAGSFKVLPVDQASMSGSAALLFTRAFADMMIMAVKILAPITAVVLAIDISLGLIGRTAPQMNIFMLGFPIKICLGILTLSILIPIMGAIFGHIFNLMEKDMLLLIKGLT